MITIAQWDAIASAAVGTQVVITCVPNKAMLPGATAFTMVGADGSILHAIVLRQEDCEGLMHADSYDKNPSVFFTVDGVRAEDQGGSIEIMAHESYHVGLLSRDEALVECTAISNIWKFIKPLHLAAKLDRWLMAGAMMAHRNTPDTYRTEC